MFKDSKHLIIYNPATLLRQEDLYKECGGAG